MVQDNSIDSSPVRHLFNTERFKRLPKLRFLKMRNVNLTGSFEHIFKDLKWLHWFGCPLESLPSDFYPKKLVILEMPCSKITRWNLTKDLNDLKSLDLSFGFELITLPDFSRLPLLESINLRGCSKLQEVDTRIGDLKNLVSLDLSDCPSLFGLPDSVCKLTALKSLKLGSCSALPEELGNMTSLTRLVVDSPSILKLPDSIRHLTKLVELRLHALELKISTVSISCFESLEILDIRCEEYMPYGVFSEMFPPNLKQVTLTVDRPMRMRRIRKLYNLKQLERLLLSNLPNLSNLKQLERLELRHCSSLTEIEGLEELISIKHLHLGGCKSMTKLSNLSNLKQLEILNLTNCSSLKEIKGLEKLISIKKLYLEGCNSIMVRKILTKSFFQISSEFGNAIEIHIDKGEELMQMSHVAGGCTEVRTNLCQEFTGWLLSFTCPWSRRLDPEDIPEFYSSPSKSFHTYIYRITGISDHFSCSEGTLMVIVPRKDLIRLREGYDDEDVVFEVTASCRCSCAGEIKMGVNNQLYRPSVKIGVYQLYRPSHDTTLTNE